MLWVCGEIERRLFSFQRFVVTRRILNVSQVGRKSLLLMKTCQLYEGEGREEVLTACSYTVGNPDSLHSVLYGPAHDIYNQLDETNANPWLRTTAHRASHWRPAFLAHSAPLLMSRAMDTLQSLANAGDIGIGPPQLVYCSCASTLGSLDQHRLDSPGMLVSVHSLEQHG